MRVLVSGATGFIGSHLLRPLLAQGHSVVGLVRRHPPQPVAGVEYCIQDLTAPLDYDVLPKKIDVIIHQATLIDTGPADTVSVDATPFITNIVGTWRILHYAHHAGVRTFVYASTGGVYGCSDRPLVEESPLNPMDYYGMTKAQAELAVTSSLYTIPMRSFNTIILRYFFPIAIGTPNPVPTYVAAAVRGETIALPRADGPRFNPISIQDTVEATIAAMDLRQDTILNIAGTEITTFGEIASFAAALCGRRLQTRVIPEEDVIPFYRSDLVADIGAMQRVLGFTPKVSLATTLAELTDHYIAALHSESRSDSRFPIGDAQA